MIGDTLAELAVKIKTDSSELTKGLSDAEGKLSNFGGIAKKVGIGMAAIGGAAIGAGIASVKAFADTADNLDEMSTRTGMSTTKLQELQYAAKLTGSSLEGMDVAMKRMAVGITGGNKALEEFGIDLTSLQGLGAEEQFNMLADIIGEIEDPTERAAIAVALFGKSGTDMIPMLEGGSAGLKKYADEANSLGIIMGEDAVKSGADFKDSLDKLQMAFGAISNQVASALMPALEPLIPIFLDLIKALPLKEFGELLKNLLPPLIDLMLKLLKAIPVDVMMKFVNSALTPMLNILTALLPILEPILYIFGQILQILTPVIDILGRVLSFIAQILGSGITSILSGITSLFGGRQISFNMPSFASGGIVPGGIGQPQLAMVHGGETIIPAGGGGGVMNVVVNVAGSVIAERDLAQILRRELLMIQDRNYSTGIA